MFHVCSRIYMFHVQVVENSIFTREHILVFIFTILYIYIYIYFNTN